MSVMQKLSIEPGLAQQDYVEAGYNMSSPSALWDELAPADFVLDSANELRPVRSLSSYITDSACSTDSGETTISNIVELYTDLVGKVPYDEEKAGVEIWQPRAYRDTIAPLLRRRFTGAESTTSLASAVTAPSVPTSVSAKEPSRIPQRFSPQQAPPFQQFSRTLRDKRAELVSPLSVLSSETFGQMAIGSVSELSLISTPQPRPFSFDVDPEMVGDLYFDVHDITLQSSHLTPTESVRELVETQPPTHTADSLLSDRPGADVPRDVSNVQYYRDTAVDTFQHQSDLPRHQTKSRRYYQGMSTMSDSPESFVIRSGVSETVKAMIQAKLTRRKEAKERARIVSVAAQKYPGVKAEQQIFQNLTRQQRRSSLKDDVSHALRRLSWPNHGADHSVLPERTLPRRAEKPAAIPLTPYQEHGAEIWYSEGKKRREGGRRKKKQEARLIQEAKTRTLEKPPPRSVASGSSHRKRSSPKSAAALLSYPSKRHTLKAALEGARNSLTQSSADKRREKLKDSIVVVGPTNLTTANTMSSARSE